MKANSFVIGMPFIPLLLPFPASSLIRTTAGPLFQSNIFCSITSS